MAESTLSLTSDQLRQIIGHHLGYGRGVDVGERAWTTPQTNTITQTLKTGLGWFYTPPALTPGAEPHSWSFLRPWADITLVQDAYTVALPDDFGYFEDNLYITSASTALRHKPLELTTDGRVEGMQASQPDRTGAPLLAAVTPIAGTNQTEGTRLNLTVWPKPDQAYALRGRYKHLPDMLDGTHPYPPGGQEHAETIKAACLAAAEFEQDDTRGPCYQIFMERLSASIAVDNRRKGTVVGYNGDNSDGRGVLDRNYWRYFSNGAVTYEGNPL